jgi:hypothetical protein
LEAGAESPQRIQEDGVLVLFHAGDALA